MPNPAILKDTVYLHHFVGEINYEAAYVTYIVKKCSLQKGFSNSSKSTTNAPPEYKSKLYIFDVDSIVTDSAGNAVSFIEPDKYERLEETDKAKYWTVTENQRDYFSTELRSGGVPTDGTPNYYKIIGYTRYDTGSKRIHHTELFGR